MTNREKYRVFCKENRSIPIFSKDWFLDAVCGKDNWDVVLVEKQRKIIASMPFYKKKKALFTIITMPKHAQTMGVFLTYPKGQKYETKLSYEKKIMQSLIEQLPTVDYFNQTFHYSITNWLPFYWKGFTQTTNYTYVIEGLSNLDMVFKNFSNGKRKDIEKAKSVVEIKFDLPAKEFYAHHKQTLEKQNAKISYSFEHFYRIYTNLYNNNSGRTLFAIDKDNNIHAALLVIWDENSGYNLITTFDPTFRSSGASTLLIQESIRFISTKADIFDFEGSMIERVEKSYRQFGAKQKPYFDITKVDSKVLKYIL
jgi:hypothetical protein